MLAVLIGEGVKIERIQPVVIYLWLAPVAVDFKWEFLIVLLEVSNDRAARRNVVKLAVLNGDNRTISVRLNEGIEFLEEIVELAILNDK